MCGIFGYANLSKPGLRGGLDPGRLKNVISLLAILNMERGTDSTGILTVDRANDISLIRKTKQSDKFLSARRVRQYVREHIDARTRVILGHTRWSTTGAVTVTNAQPFICGTVAGTHNGIISNWEELKKSHALPYTSECDSEVLFRLAERAATTAQLVGFLDEICGSFACAHFDKRKPEQMTFYRASNPLALAWNPRGRYLLWTSSENHMLAVQHAFNLELVAVEQLADNTLLTIDSDKHVTAHKLNPKISYYHYNQNTAYGGGSGAGRGWWRDRDKEAWETPAIASPSDTARRRCDFCGGGKKVRWSAEYDSMLCKHCRQNNALRNPNFDLKRDVPLHAQPPTRAQIEYQETGNRIESD